MISLLVITDGRWGYLTDTLASAEVNLPSFGQVVLVDDSGTADGVPLHLLEAAARLGPLTYVHHEERRGLAGAVQSGWDHVDGDFVFHLEDDFTFVSPVDVDEMVQHLQRWDNLAQVALLRQPWSPEEHAAGGIYGVDPDAYTNRGGLMWHRRLFTFNPCVYPRIVTDYGAGLEREVTDNLLDKGWHFAYLGNRHDDPRCTHIGVTRSVGYRW